MKIWKTIAVTGAVAVQGFCHYAVDAEVLAVAGAVGLGQGLKYKGSLKQGLAGAAASIAVMGLVGSIGHVVHNWDNIAEIVEEDIFEDKSKVVDLSDYTDFKVQREED